MNYTVTSNKINKEVGRQNLCLKYRKCISGFIKGMKEIMLTCLSLSIRNGLCVIANKEKRQSENNSSHPRTF